MNPELRQTFNTISRNLESANEAAQVNFYDFTSHYIDPCLGSIRSCISDCTASCFPSTDDQLRRKRGRSRGRADFDFDFYDDWEEEEEEHSGGVGWRNDELDSLLAGRGQPRLQRAMSYGARVRRNEPDSSPNVIPKSSYLGFLDRLPFKIGPKGIRYKPSSAGLRENPGGLRIRDVEHESLREVDEHDEHPGGTKHKGHARNRSHTGASQSTTTSHSARSDLIMSDEDDDAVPLDDEFAAVMLSRRTTSSGFDEPSGGKISSGKRPNLSRVSTRSVSSKSLHADKTRRSSSKRNLHPLSPNQVDLDEILENSTKIDMKQTDSHFDPEELEIAMKRETAKNLALNGDASNEYDKTTESFSINGSHPTSPDRAHTEQNVMQGSPASPTMFFEGETEPFPDVSSLPRTPEEDGKPP